MLMLKKLSKDDKCLLKHGQEVVGNMSVEHADLLMKMEEQNQNMAMLLRMMIIGRDVKDKANTYLAENGF